VASRFRQGLWSYPGLKEDVYAASFAPDLSFLAQLGVDAAETVATIRPPAVEAHYHNPESEGIFAEVVDFLGSIPNLRMVMLPRNDRRERELYRSLWPQWSAERKIIIPDRVVDGLNLIWHSDLVISGGGTMNREAAALGVPVYSIFRGRLGAVDAYLASQGRLTLVQSRADVRTTIRPVKRARGADGRRDQGKVLAEIMAGIESVLGRSVPLGHGAPR
jgi:predicted glycosyltransferase